MILILLFLFLIPQTSLCRGPQTPSEGGRLYSLEEAQRVVAAIERVSAAAREPWTGKLRVIAVSESELNSYIAYRIETEKEEIMKELRLKLFDRNRIEGKILIDLRSQNAPGFIRPEMTIYFAAELKVADGAVKVDITRLFLEEQPIQPYVIDAILAISARLSGQKPTSINDWYELPYGIKDIRTKKGKALFYY